MLASRAPEPERSGAGARSIRPALVLAHRWIGLVLAGFVALAGLTGALLAWYHELDAAANPALMRASPPAPDAEPLDPLALRERVLDAFPGTHVRNVPLAHVRGESVLFYVEPAPGVAPLPFDEVYVHPYTGEILGTRLWGDIGAGWTNAMPFVYRLHYALALDTLGAYLMGIVALLWSLDCFVALVLTLPPRARSAPSVGWWSRWVPAWKVRRGRGAFRLNFDLHRAGGLWPWALLFVFAWSSVAFNLQEVYRPVMGTAFEFQDPFERLQELDRPQVDPPLGWNGALARGRELLASEAAAHGLEVRALDRLQYYPASGTFRLRAHTDRDVGTRYGSTAVYFSGVDGRHLQTYLPTGAASGDTVTEWLYALHMGTIGGTTYRVLVTAIGFVVALLAVTGVVVWNVKRRARALAARPDSRHAGRLWARGRSDTSPKATSMSESRRRA